MSIILVGLKNAGKTSIGQQIALLKNWDWQDTDDLMLDSYNNSYAKTVDDIHQVYQELGEQKFRSLETEVIFTYQPNKFGVLSTGGGSFLKSRTRELLDSKGIIYYLYLSKEQFKDRMAKTKHTFYADRDLDVMYNDRVKILADLPAHTILVENKSIRELCKEIIDIYE